MAKDKTWHPCNHGIYPLIVSLVRFGTGRIRFDRSEPDNRVRGHPSGHWRIATWLEQEISQPTLWGGWRGNRETLRRWLQFHGFAADAAEFSTRLTDLLARLKDLVEAWNPKAPIETDDPDKPVNMDWLRDYLRLQEEALDLADYLQQLSWMLEKQFGKKLQALPTGERPILSETDKKVAAYIRKHPGELGDAIARACEITYDHFRRIFRNKLRPHGFYNPGSLRGYFPPSRRRRV